MRYIGNKTKLLDEIERLLREEGVRGGRFFDIFSGTASVARHFRALGFEVTANDRMLASFVLAKAALEVAAPAPASLREHLQALSAAPDEEGLIARQYSPLGPARRGFFTEANALRIDAALETLTRWRADRRLEPGELYLCLAAVIEAADRVANISGTYGAFLKTWQPNATRPLELRLPEVPRGPRGAAFRADSNRLVAEVPCDVLYIDPPYNDREYAANYHVLEAVAARPFLDRAALARFEGSIYGKTGLQPYEKSAFSTAKGCAPAFRDLVARSRARHVVVSYNEEGILSWEEIRAALGDGLETNDVRFEDIRAKRFRSDRDGDRRNYRVLPGRGRDEIAEWLFYARRPRIRAILPPCRPCARL